MAKEVYHISENEIKEQIRKAIAENRKVIKLPSQQPQPTPPPMTDPMGGGMDPNMGAMGADPMGGGMDPMAGGDPMGGMPQDGAGDEANQFDHNFDAGVEADENADPQKYIQQLTGKLSQTLNKDNDENGPDAGICKYVASMIVTATCKNLDEKAKKEIIDKINGASSDTGDEENVPMDDGGMEGDMGDMNTEPQNIQETKFTKRSLREMLSDPVLDMDKRQDLSGDFPKKRNRNSIFNGKKF